MMFDKELMKQLTTIPAEDRAKWFEERDKLETLAVEMTLNHEVRHFYLQHPHEG